MSILLLPLLLVLLAVVVLILLWVGAAEGPVDTCPSCDGPLDYASGGRWDCPRCSGF